MNEKDWTTVPVLPCKAIGETLAFWENLGFTITYRQDRPYQYGVVERNGHQLHFVRVKGAEAGYIGCLMMVQDVGQVYTNFTRALKAMLGKVPHTGIPRISRMRPGQSRFTITDVSENAVIVIQFGEKDQVEYEDADPATLTPLQKAISLALRLRDFKEDYPAAVKVLDTALAKMGEAESAEDEVKARGIRSSLTDLMEDLERDGHLSSDGKLWIDVSAP
ncbi:MAG: hypothetical protein J7619_10835 [Dyadobacter sp.]|uniref:hypothetical protein n=1 Tax=Dyadobacter sp. TaxID=1914288 RepID=UPI001B27605C|nr:hypothetical protein [Dyadobacter sp.]MBO9613183.1 hypothetical protein [Dyadobacter sp.]